MNSATRISIDAQSAAEASDGRSVTPRRRQTDSKHQADNTSVAVNGPSPSPLANDTSGVAVACRNNAGATPTQLKIASPYVLEARQLYKTYRKHQHEVPVLKGCDFRAVAGKVTAILGHSGSGKSTLLHLLGTLDAPDAGEIYFDSERIDALPRRRRDQFRNAKLGMIFQFYHLLPEISALQNVLLPMMIKEGFLGYIRQRHAIRARARELLSRVGLDHRLHHKPSELSGGEMQRAAIARALIADPELLLADEPTGNLDRETGKQILALLAELQAEQGLTIVMVTHDESIAANCDSVIHLVDGRMKN